MGEPCKLPVLCRLCLLGLIVCMLSCRSAPAKHKRPGFLQASHLIIEIPNLVPCNASGNAVDYYNVQNKMISKVDFALNADFNVTRNAQRIDSMILKVTKCREIVSTNTCELFQTWRFDKDPCVAVRDPRAVWKSALDSVDPHPYCPLKVGVYHMRNLTMTGSVLNTVPLPWEGNIWLIRLTMMDTKTQHHVCTDIEMRVHRVRDG